MDFLTRKAVFVSPAEPGTFQAYWDSLYQNRNPLVVTSILSLLVHEISFFGSFLPFILCETIPWLHKYKIQKSKENTMPLFWKCLKYILFTHFVIQVPMQTMFHPIAEYFGMKMYGVPFPDWTTMVSQIALFMLMEDAFHYWFHRALHYGPLYKMIHKQHHEFTAPFGIASEYAHPLETMILGMGTIGSPLLYSVITGDLHLITVFTWVFVRTAQAIDSHSGYDFPWSLRKFVPFWAGADFHDHHHMVFLGNYSSSFRFWDWMCGTDARYNAWKAKLKQNGAEAGKEATGSALKEE